MFNGSWLRVFALLCVAAVIACEGPPPPALSAVELLPTFAERPAELPIGQAQKNGQSTSTWTRLLNAHGSALLGVEMNDVKNATVLVSNRELVVMFDWPMTSDDKRVIRPQKRIDYEAVSDELGARKVGEIPGEYMMRCGENHGGDFEVAGAKYGIYASGGCYHVRIFNPTHDAVRLLLGEAFLPLLDACDTLAVGPACRTADRLKIGVRGKPVRAVARYGRRGTKLTQDGEWLVAEVPHTAAKETYDTVMLVSASVACVYDLPELSPPNKCGLEGPGHRPDDECIDSEECKRDGQCATVNGTCQPTVSAHCEESLDCANHGACFLQGNECVATEEGCREHRICKSQGKCSVSGDHCAPLGDDCRAIDRCKTRGDCTAINGKCRPGSDADCAQSDSCRKRGDCGFANGRCTKTTAAHCRRSDACQKNGYCVVSKHGAGCRHCWTQDKSWPKEGWSWDGGVCRKKQ